MSARYPEIRGIGADPNAWRKPMPVVPPDGYVPPTMTDYQATPESKTGLYIGIAAAVLVVAGGAFLFFTRD